jgi:soluble lytic murein transglycosylase-like protein
MSHAQRWRGLVPRPHARALVAVAALLAAAAVGESAAGRRHRAGPASRVRHLPVDASTSGLAMLRAPAPVRGAGPTASPVAAALPRRVAVRPADPIAAEHEAEREAFARDLAAGGAVAPHRARTLAALAVREARAHRVPTPLLLGVLLVENEPLNSRAVSSAGARGLMQVHPLWRPLLGPTHGFDLEADSTNLAMGAHILGDLIARARTLGDVERGLLRYNGCRRALLAAAGRGPRGAPPAPCAAYPGRVRQRVEQRAAALCPSRSFARCVVRPIRVAAASASARDPRNARGTLATVRGGVAQTVGRATE